MKKTILIIISLLFIAFTISKLFFSDKEIYKNKNTFVNINMKNNTEIIYPNKSSMTKNENIINKEFSEDEIIETREFVSSMKEEYTKVQFDTIFKDKLKNLYNKNKDVSKIFKEIILDNNFAKDISAEDQAYARIFALNGLKEIALINDKKPLLNTIQEFSLILQNKENFSKGEKADLDDLIRNYISIIDKDSFIHNIGHYLKEIKFNKEIKNGEVLKIYKNSVFFSLMEKVDEEKARKLLEQHFSK